MAYIWHFRRIGIKATKFILKVTFSLPSPSSMLKLPSVSPIPRVQYFKSHHMLTSNLVAPLSVRALKILQLRVGLAGRCCVQLHYGHPLGNKFWPSFLCNFFTANESCKYWVRNIMLENLSIILWSVTLKTSALYLKLDSKSSRCSTDLGYIWCPFPCLLTEKYLHKPETQYRIASITNFQRVNDE